MNITHVVENLNRGGLERMVLELVKLQQQQGHRCQVVCIFERGSLAHELDDRHVPLIVGGKRKGLDLRALARVRHAVRQHRTDVLHTHNAVAHYQGVLATLGLGIGRTITTRHGMGENSCSRRREWLFRRALIHTQTVVTVCDAARRAAVQRGIVPAEKAAAIPNGIRVEDFQITSASAREQLRKTLGLGEGAQIVGTVGRLNWAKDQAGLIRAFRKVRERLPDAALVFVGDGELRVELERLAAVEGVADGVHFLGDRSELLRGFDIFALSSLSEGYSMALLEACAVALPIVATDVGGNGEIVRDGATGLLVPPRDPGAMANALIGLLEQPTLARALGDAARRWVKAEGSLESMAERYAVLYGIVSA
jgi:glycosyltransferase involved in cell wall biosynthesis